MSLKKVNFVFIVHNHQPIGNFDHIIAKAVDDAYAPFIQAIAEFPDIPFGLHITGPLWEWIEIHRPSFWEAIARMAERGQVEIIGGGFYEPILPVLPDRDQIGQLQLMNAEIRAKFGAIPQGAWIAERVWEPQLPQPLVQAGLKYTFLDDTHFHSAGCKPEELDGIFLTDHAGYQLRLFPISQRMRYAVPFKAPEVALQEILSASKEDEEALVCLADDGEKFGLWPGTYGTCYEEKWLERFFRLLVGHKDQIEVLRPQEAAAKLKPKGRVYLPTASYFEMTEWALPADASYELTGIRKELEAEGCIERFKPFLKGGHWRNFFAKYEESARIYQRMLQVSECIANLPDNPLKIQARRELYKAQCNCAYWHGIFGGLYLPHLRSALWEQLIKAQRLSCWDAEGPPQLRLADVDGDGAPEIRLSDNNLAVTIRTGDGSIDDIEVSPPPINLTDTLTRRPEAYHRDLAEAVLMDANSSGTIHSGLRIKEEHLENWLIYDSYPRRAAIEHIIGVENGLEAFRRGRSRLKVQIVKTEYSDNSAELYLSSIASDRPINYRKRLSLTSNILECSYRLDEFDKSLLGQWLGSEWCLNLRDGHSDQSYIEVNGVRPPQSCLDDEAVYEQVNRLDLVCLWMPIRVTIILDPAALVFITPLYTVSASEAGVERVFQGSMLLLGWEIKDALEAEIKLRITNANADANADADADQSFHQHHNHHHHRHRHQPL